MRAWQDRDLILGRSAKASLPSTDSRIALSVLAPLPAADTRLPLASRRGSTPGLHLSSRADSSEGMLDQPTPMRIAMLSESYFPRISGVVHSLAAFVEALRRSGHRVYVVAPRYPGFVDGHPDVIRFPSVRLPHDPEFPLGIPITRSLWQRLLQIELDIVHAHAPFLMGAVSARLARMRGLPLVFTHHTLYDEYVHYARLPAWLTRPLVRRYTTAFANRCACVIAPSRFIAARLRRAGVTARIEVLSTGAIDPELFASLDPTWVRIAFGIPAGRPLLVTSSRLAREKSVDLVLRACAEIIRQRDALMLVVGGGPEEPALRQLVLDLGLDRYVIFAGLQPHRKALECVSAADVFVYASQTETQGLVVVEAMACGVPVVAVEAGGIPDAVRDGETGYLAPPSPAALAEKVIILLDHPERRAAMGQRAREVAREFSLLTLTDRLQEIYRSLAFRMAD